MSDGQQLNLFPQVAKAYAETGDEPLDNKRLYAIVTERAGIALEDFEAKVPVGNCGQRQSLLARQIRWHQQSLKRLGLLERVDGHRGLWRLTKVAKKELHQAEPGVAMVAYSTDLGICIWGRFETVFPLLDEPIQLIISSFPYVLRKPRAYGNPTDTARLYADFACRAVEPLLKNLAPGGSIVVNVSNDLFEEGLPSRSTYIERMVVAFEDRLGLSLMDRHPWINPSKPPGPVEYASKKRIHMNVGWEPIYWFTNDPTCVKANNQNTLLPHTERHKRFVANGGEKQARSYSDGAYTVKPGSYSKETPGRIHRNFSIVGHNCPENRMFHRLAKQLNLPAHGAPFPRRLYDLFIQHLTDVGDLCVDLFSGRGTMGVAAEELGRRWLMTEWILEYPRIGAERARNFKGFWMNPAMDEILAAPRCC